MGNQRGNKTISEVILEYNTDKRSLADSEKANASILKSLKDLDAAFAAYDQGLASAVQVQQQQVTSLGTYNAALSETSQRVLAERAAEEGVIQTHREGARAVEDYAKAYSDASKQAKSFGDVSTNLSQISTLARGVGLGGVADVANVGGDIVASIQAASRLGPALRESMKTAQSAVADLTGVVVGGGGLAAGLGVAAIAVAAITVAIAAFKAANEEATRGVVAYIAARQRANQADVTPEVDRQAAIEETNRTLEQATADLAFYQQNLDELTNGLGVFSGAALAVGRLAGARGIPEIEAEIARLQGVIQDANFDIARLRDETTAAASAALDLAQAEADLAEERDTKAQGAIASAIASARAQDEQALRSYADAQLAALDADREAARFLDEKRGLQERAAQQQQALKDASGGRVDQLRSAFDDFLGKANVQIAEAEAEVASKRDELNAKYMADTLKETQKYLRAEVRAKEDANKALIRRTQDLNDDLLSAQEANDVIRFIQVQRQGKKDLSRMSEDVSTAAQRRAEDFALEMSQHEDERKTRLDELKSSADERIATIRENIRKQKDQLDEQIRQESVALKERLANAAAASRQEINDRIAAHNASINEELGYSKARLTIQAQLNASLAALASQSFGQIAAQARAQLGLANTVGNALTYGGFGSGAYNTSSTAKSSGVVFNIQTGNIGSDLTQNQVQKSIANGLATFMQATTSGLSTGAFKK